MDFTIRPAVLADHARLIEVADEGDFAGCDSAYLSFISATGRLLTATAAGEVVAYGGMVLVDQAAMVTDLFVAPSTRGSGIGSRLLAELLAGVPARMTFSAQHPAAQAAYRRSGMHSRGRMLYLSGAAAGGGAPLRPANWTHSRIALVEYFARRGAIVCADSIVHTSEHGVEVLRMDTADAIDECQRLLSSFDPGVPMSLYVPEPHPLASWLLARGFRETDHDLLFTSDGVALSPTLAVLHPGLA